MPQIKLIFKTGENQQTITGYARTLPAPMIFPPIFNLSFKTGHETKGDVWDKDRFDVDSCVAEYEGKTYNIGKSMVSLRKDDEREYTLDVMIRINEPPFGEGFPFLNGN